MAILDEVKLLKGIPLEDTVQDDLLNLIIRDSEERILAFVNLHSTTPLGVLPESVSYIVRDVAVKRYNKLNSEGATSDSEEGRSFSWESNYLSGYEEILANLVDNKRPRGIARFI